MFTVITEGNNVRQYHGVEYLHEVRKTENDYVVVNDTGEVEVYAGNPITWPTAAINGLQAIVDVKAGTLRFGHDEIIGLTEFVVSEYVEPTRQAATREEVMALVETWPTDWNKTGEKLTNDWIWAVLGGQPVIINQTDKLASNTVISEDEWRNHNTQSVQPQVTATSMLTAALGHMEDRAKTYDTPGGERSMGKTVSAFNTITGLELTEEQGWLFMEILKQVRSQQGNYRADNYEDMVAYAALRGECAARERGNKS